MNNEAAYSRPVTLKSILRFAVPTIAMSVFMSFYTMVDGLFVSNRHQRFILDQSGVSHHSAGHSNFNYACDGGQRSHYEKNGRREKR